MVSDRYVGEFNVGKDGHVAFEEEFINLEHLCNKCYADTLVGVKGTVKVFRELARLRPMQRVIKALDYIVDGTLELADGLDLVEALEMAKGFRDKWKELHRSEEERRAAEEFMRKVEGIIGKWKLLAEP
jgi:hypothetical protein